MDEDDGNKNKTQKKMEKWKKALKRGGSIT
jgi:hypothetical protein